MAKIFFSDVNQERDAFVDYKKMYQNAQALLDKLNIPYDPHEKRRKPDSIRYAAD